MRQFPASPITELIDGSPQYNLGESYAPHLSVADILDPDEVAGLSLGYGTSAGDAELRALIAARLGRDLAGVLIQMGRPGEVTDLGPRLLSLTDGRDPALENQVHAVLARAHISRGAWAEARAHLEEARLLGSEDPRSPCRCWC